MISLIILVFALIFVLSAHRREIRNNERVAAREREHHALRQLQEFDKF